MDPLVKEFRRVYADAVTVEEPDDAAYRIRQLNWKSGRVSLSVAAECYRHLVGGYNNFEPDMVGELSSAFPETPIYAYMAREGSVTIYLEVQSKFRKSVKKFIKDNWHADEISQDKEGIIRVWWD